MFSRASVVTLSLSAKSGALSARFGPVSAVLGVRFRERDQPLRWGSLNQTSTLPPPLRAAAAPPFSFVCVCVFAPRFAEISVVVFDVGRTDGDPTLCARLDPPQHAGKRPTQKSRTGPDDERRRTTADWKGTVARGGRLLERREIANIGSRGHQGLDRTLARTPSSSGRARASRRKKKRAHGLGLCRSANPKTLCEERGAPVGGARWDVLADGKAKKTAVLTKGGPSITS